MYTEGQGAPVIRAGIRCLGKVASVPSTINVFAITDCYGEGQAEIKVKGSNMDLIPDREQYRKQTRTASDKLL